MDASVCRVGLVGAGVVGGGVAEMLLTRADLLEERAGVKLELVAVAERDAGRARAAGIPDSILVDHYAKVISNPDVDVVVELIGGTGVAADVVREAIAHGKSVVTANKALLAENGLGLFGLARKKGVAIAFEASVCGGIPLLLAVREGLVVNRFQSLLGIVNGTCNYILSQMDARGVSFDSALSEAQRLGFAEADPTTDINGFDSGHKLALLSALAFETWIDFPKLHIQGIRNVSDLDIKLAKEMGYTLKLLACAWLSPTHPNCGQKSPSPAAGGADKEPSEPRLYLSVHPALLTSDHPLASVQGSMNGVDLRGDVVGEGAYFGRGAGRYPTASAVVADLVQLARARAGGDISRAAWNPRPRPRYELAPMADYQARYYLRFVVADRPGVLAQIAGALGKRGVSIAAVRQWERYEGATSEGRALVTITTYTAREGDIHAALSEMATMDFLRDAPTPTLLRIEE